MLQACVHVKSQGLLPLLNLTGSVKRPSGIVHLTSSPPLAESWFTNIDSCSTGFWFAGLNVVVVSLKFPPTVKLINTVSTKAHR